MANQFAILMKLLTSFCSLQLICTGYYYPNWVNEQDSLQTGMLIVGISAIIHLILSGVIAVTKYRWNLQDKAYPKNGTDFGTLAITWLGMSLLVIGIANFALVNASDPEKFSQPGNKLALLNLYFVLPVFAFFTVGLSFYAANKKLSKELKSFLGLSTNQIGN